MKQQLRWYKGGNIYMKQKSKRKDPLLLSFIGAAVICGIVTGIVFLCVGNTNSRLIRRQYQQKQAEQFLADWSTQLQTLSDLSASIAFDDT